MATSVWRGYISFGLISIPVRLFKAARTERISLRQVYKVSADTDAESEDGPSSTRRRGRASGKQKGKEPVEEAIAPVRRVASTGDASDILPETKVLKGYEVEDGRFVTIDAEELKALETRTATQMEVLEFVRLQDVDPVYFETSYYVRPEPGGEKPFALLFEALRRAGLVALARFAMHRREHVTLIRSGRYGLIAHTMFYATEVRSEEEFRAETSLLQEKEIKLADTLVRSLTAEFEPEKYHDSYRQKLEALIASKVAGKATMPSAPSRKLAPVVDIMEALKASLQMRKPPASAKTPEATATGRPRKSAKTG